MLHTILLDVETKLKQSSTLNDARIGVLIHNMELWKKGNVVYPSVVKSLLGLSTFKETYAILNLLMDMGIVEYGFQGYCSHCKRLLDMPILSSLVEFPKEIYCECADNPRLNPSNDLILVYVVIKDE